MCWLVKSSKPHGNTNCGDKKERELYTFSWTFSWEEGSLKWSDQSFKVLIIELAPNNSSGNRDLHGALCLPSSWACLHLWGSPKFPCSSHSTFPPFSFLLSALWPLLPAPSPPLPIHPLPSLLPHSWSCVTSVAVGHTQPWRHKIRATKLLRHSSGLDTEYDWSLSQRIKAFVAFLKSCN